MDRARMEMRQTGIEAIGEAPWGTHVCQFYGDKEDLAAILVPYFKAGLEGDERCLWVTSPPLEVEEAWEALGRAVPELASYRARGRIEILRHTEWYLLGGRFDPERVLRGWVEKLEGALARGCQGLRLSGDTFWLESSDWRGFTEYEAAIGSVLGRHRMLALCTYALERCSAAEVADVIRNHELALLKRDGVWQRFESFERRQMAEAHARAQREVEERYRLLFDHLSEGFAVHELLHDEAGRPCDYRFLELNPAFEAQTGLRKEQTVGRRVRELLPELEPSWIERYARVVETGVPVRFESRAGPLGRCYEVLAFRPSAGKFATLFFDVSERKRTEQELLRVQADLKRAQAVAETGSWRLDVRENRLLWSEESYRIFGIPEGTRLSYERFLDAVHPEDREQVDRCWAAALRGEPYEIEHRICVGDRVSWVRERAELELDGDGRLLGGFGTVQDITARKRVEAALQQQEEWFRVTLSSIGDAVMVTDPTGAVTFMNTVAEELTGWTERSWSGRPLGEVFRIVNEETGLPVANPAARVLESGRVQGLANHTVLVARDGSRRPIDDSAAPIRDPRGGLLGVVLVFRDIAERKVNERRLAHLASFPERNPTPIVEVDLEGRIRYANPAARSQLPGIEEQGAAHPYLAGWEAVARTLREGSVATGAREVTAGARQYHQALCYLPDQQTVRVYGFEITERARAEAALRESVAQFRALTEALPQIVWTADPEGGIDWYNRRWYEYTGAPSGVGEGWSWDVVSHPEDLAPTLERWQEARRSRSSFENEIRIRRHDGEFRWFLVRAWPVTDAGGEVVRWVGTNTDIDAIKRAESERERHLAAIQEANEAKDLFFNTLSHELRTPLSAMLNGVEVLKNPEATAGQRARVIGLLERNVRHQTRLIDDLLDLARIMRKKVTIAVEPLDLRQLLEAQIEGIEAAARRGRVAVLLEAPAQVPVCGDPLRLGQIVSNLLVNAVKFTEPGGEVRVRVDTEGEQVVVRVTDTGIGIAPELLPQVFEAFRQAETSLARSRGGLGIGLAVARSLAELHGGRLEGASAGLGRGSEFALQLPLRVEPAPSRLTTPSAGARSSGRRVLVVEDNTDLRESLKILLELMGHTVLSATNGAHAIELAAREQPELALIDIGLPDMDGYELVRRLREDLQTRPMRLVAMTGYATSEHRARALAAGFDRHLAKPVGADELRRALDGEPS